MTKVFDLHFINTICFPTKRNQEQIKELAKDSDVMLIIGSYTSANSKRLTKLALKDTKCKDLEKFFNGPTAAAISSDPITSAKILAKYAKGASPLKIVAGKIKKKIGQLLLIWMNGWLLMKKNYKKNKTTVLLF